MLARSTTSTTSFVSALAAALVIGWAAGAHAQPKGPHAGHASPTGDAAKVAPLSDAVEAAIEEALQDERLGEAVYARVLEDHGDVRPFSNVVRAERRHAEFLEDLLKARGLAVPAARGGVEVPAYASVKEACAAAVDFETKNVALYDRLIAAGPLPEDVKQAFDHNRMASVDHHKPAFERCAGAASAQGQGRGCRAGRGASRHASGNGCGRGCGHGGGQGGRGHGRT